MEKIVKYKAYDGAEFDTEAECLAHESESGLYMFDADGQRVHSTRDAMIVYIAPGAKHAYRTFYKMCEMEDISYGGVVEDEDDAREKDEEGLDDMLYIWDEWEDYYRIVDDEIKKLVMTAAAARKAVIDKE